MNYDLENKEILFIDGQCIMCNGLVNKILDSGKYKDLLFGTLSGDTYEKITREIESPVRESVVLYSEGNLYYKSQAILTIGKKMGGFYSFLAGIGRIFPLNFRNMVYDFVARNRYRWFGKKDEDYCELPHPEQRIRLVP